MIVCFQSKDRGLFANDQIISVLGNNNRLLLDSYRLRSTFLVSNIITRDRKKLLVARTGPGPRTFLKSRTDSDQDQICKKRTNPVQDQLSFSNHGPAHNFVCNVLFCFQSIFICFQSIFLFPT